MMIKPDAVPVGHVSPYKRIDLMHPGRKAVITTQDFLNSGSLLPPDPAAYDFDCVRQCWILKEGV